MKPGYVPRVHRSYIGAYRPRIDGFEKASGRAKYAADLMVKCRAPGILYAKVLRSPFPHARIRHLEVSQAAQLEGVVDVLTFEDPDVACLKATNAGWTDGVDTLSYERMMWRAFRDRRVLGSHARWVGDEVGAVVAAESEEIAEEALRLLKVDWEILPFVLDPVAAMAPHAPILHPEAGETNVLPEDTVGGADVFVNKGDVTRGFAEADVVVDATTTYHNATQNSLDNWCCLVEWRQDQVTVWSNSYEAHQTRMHISEMLGVPLNSVRVVSPYVGGQFGRGDTGDQPFFLFTALLARRTGRPVLFRHSRRESFHDGRQHVRYEGTIGAKNDGTITALSFNSIGNVGAYADHSMFALKFAPVEATEVAFAHIPHVRFEGRGVYTNKMPACMMRGVGNSQLNLILGRLVDGLAEALNIDPLEVACKNFGHEWEELPNKSLVAVLRAGAGRISWQDTRHLPGAGPLLDGLKRRGVGFSFHPGWHAEWQEIRRGEVHVTITVNADCSVTLDAPTVETGTGSNTCNVLGCAEALSFLGISTGDIHWISTVDTDSSPQDCVQTDSAVSFLQSEVIAAASREVKVKLLERVAPLLDAAPSELEIDMGFVYRKDSPDRKRGLKELLYESSLDPVTVAVSRRPLDTRTGIPFIATFAEVEVNTDTGQVVVLQLVVVNDCGTVMYASGAEAQQIGGQCIALGESLTEEIIYDDRTGFPLNFNWIDYQIPTMADMPEIDPILLEVWRGAGEYGACGLGEGTVTCTPRAVLNAIYNAIGVRIDSIPVKPAAVLEALGKVI
ncbi:MAG: molybdopterin cofactor-binding domain-containing protein [Acidimicrobiales bacterium]